MKTRDRRVKSVSQRKTQDKKGTQEISRGSKRDRTTGTAHSGDTQGKSHARAKRSGVEAVKLHLKATGDPGRTSRSATAAIRIKVRKTSVRMTAIKEYPFDLSDLQNQPVAGEDKPSALQQITVPTRKKSKLSVGSQDGKRKVSIMADESSKDRENLPSERERQTDRQTNTDRII
ncbi:unnamed protein product [Arctia plantaginis]|uniref:Uncharacterized protein n=1 Tax=Arctia plantaginis TaxID=874455 RepID=A0A8S1AY00_ARCPL|nr:unnamed protein product [Arctia plantaginis]